MLFLFLHPFLLSSFGQKKFSVGSYWDGSSKIIVSKYSTSCKVVAPEIKTICIQATVYPLQRANFLPASTLLSS